MSDPYAALWKEQEEKSEDNKRWIKNVQIPNEEKQKDVTFTVDKNKPALNVKMCKADNECKPCDFVFTLHTKLQMAYKIPTPRFGGWDYTYNRIVNYVGAPMCTKCDKIISSSCKPVYGKKAEEKYRTKFMQTMMMPCSRNWEKTLG